MSPAGDASNDRSGAARARRVWCIVVAGGAGRRFGSAKQFARLGGGTVLERSLAAARGAVDAVVVVVPAEHVAEPEVAGLGADAVVAGGATRADSVRAGLAAVPGDAEVVLVHDAARPLASTELFERVRDAVLGGAGAVVPVVPVVDTIRHVDGGVVDRDQLRVVQTPQGFDAALLRRAHAGGGDATDDAGLVEAIGAPVTMVEGESTNLKLTGPEDLAVAAALLGGVTR